MILAVVRDRFVEFAVDCGLGTVVVAVAMYALITLFRRNRGDGGDAGPRDGPGF